jgi:hypothetical protein
MRVLPEKGRLIPPGMEIKTTYTPKALDFLLFSKKFFENVIFDRTALHEAPGWSKIKQKGARRRWRWNSGLRG